MVNGSVIRRVIWKKDFCNRKGELSIFQTHRDSPGTWNNNKVNFEVIYKGGIQSSRPAEISLA
jgi:hypothetical protein